MAPEAYTAKLAEHIAGITWSGLAPEVCAHSAYLFLDFVGLAAKGLSMESTRAVHAMIRKLGGSGHGTVVGDSLQPLPQYAALANAAASHSMSLDDIYTPASIHPGSAIFAAALAAAENTGADGKRFTEGVVAGYDTTLRVADAVGVKSHYAFGWHPTATCGTFGATAAVARILELDAAKTANAFGIAGSMASGLMAFMVDGSWTKRIHPGLAAQRGIQAAYLAAEGFKGPQAVLESKWGFLAATSTQADAQRLVSDFGGRPRVMDTGLKLHACCRYNQSAIDAALEIMRVNALDWQEVEKIRVEIFKAAYPLVVEPLAEKMSPRTDVQAQFSLPYTVALAVVKGKVSFEEFSSVMLQDPAVRDTMQRVTVVHDPALDAEFPQSWPARVVIRTRDCRTFEKRMDYPKGDIENPLTWEELIARFNVHSLNVFDASRQARIVDAVKKLATFENLAELGALLRP